MKRTLKKSYISDIGYKTQKEIESQPPTICFQYIKGYAHTRVYKLLVEEDI